MKSSLLLIAAFVVSFSLKAQFVFEPSRTYQITGDTIKWNVPEFQASGQFLFNQLEPSTHIRLPFTNEKPVHIEFSQQGNNIKLISPSKLMRTIAPIKVIRGNEAKILNVTFLTPFSPTFSDRYIKPKAGQVVFENPALYELVNIAFSLTKKGSEDKGTFNINTSYYNDIVEYFGKFRNHPLIEKLNKLYQPGSSEYRMYRESAYNYSLVKGLIEVTGPYRDFEEGNTILEDRELWEDFIRASNYEVFYQRNTKFYRQELDHAKETLPVEQMWKWCEQKFPGKYHTYRIVISPLVNGFHSTQNINSREFNECIMFICGVGNITAVDKTDREVSYSALLLTEIDHNYINPISAKFETRLKAIFGQDWVTPGSQGAAYGNGMAYFNEYLTHAVYLLYVEDFYSETVLANAVRSRIELMEWRGFPRFKEFYNELRSLHKSSAIRNDLTLAYEPIMSWVENYK
jgi:hypothetical protein